jgi:hypothetical protein
MHLQMPAIIVLQCERNLFGAAYGWPHCDTRPDQENVNPRTPSQIQTCFGISKYCDLVDEVLRAEEIKAFRLEGESPLGANPLPFPRTIYNPQTRCGPPECWTTTRPSAAIQWHPSSNQSLNVIAAFDSSLAKSPPGTMTMAKLEHVVIVIWLMAKLRRRPR